MNRHDFGDYSKILMDMGMGFMLISAGIGFAGILIAIAYKIWTSNP